MSTISRGGSFPKFGDYYGDIYGFVNPVWQTEGSNAQCGGIETSYGYCLFSNYVASEGAGKSRLYNKSTSILLYDDVFGAASNVQKPPIRFLRDETELSLVRTSAANPVTEVVVAIVDPASPSTFVNKTGDLPNNWVALSGGRGGLAPYAKSS
jgi:hypothetical protein